MAAFKGSVGDLTSGGENGGTRDAQEADLLAGPIQTRPAARSTGCGVHLPPFDAVEWTNNRRPGWVRVTCRRCGRFLGNHPAT